MFDWESSSIQAHWSSLHKVHPHTLQCSAFGESKGLQDIAHPSPGTMFSSSNAGSIQRQYACSKSQRDRTHGWHPLPAPPRPEHTEFMGQSCVPYLLARVTSGKAATPNRFTGDTVGRHQHSANVVGPFPLDVDHGPCWKWNESL